MYVVRRLTAEHAAAVLAFERENRAFFAASVGDRGDAYFASFEERHRALLAYQDAGTDHFHVVLDRAGAVLARVNLMDVADGSATLGYRVAEAATGRGVATRAAREVCRRAGAEYGLTELRAVAAWENVASRRVLARVGFEETGPTLVSGRPGLAFRRVLEGATGAAGVDGDNGVRGAARRG
ncbi:ribosomal-protein-alanine N-acetyltransferase [Streptomyces zhaozhouensis]|uniref:Ribosomal-protein-alanine N-acetyltransferase n=1 Tax=Streptomyces zhaozhouensis TaxID=1300267 RepID=A0A286DWI6_9ACTN|nr:GNAT family N-acetyltransferase [Streptomyces zhaozhouensis]SOD63025.1 ribosomal-protein-alanine N-acetyltransferase [Streptomyces zhaozhouensis]